MTHHPAITLSPALGVGVSFAITTETFAVNDVLDIHTASGDSLTARIERFDMSGLELSVGMQTFTCRPWKRGDPAVRRDIGATSDWTVQSRPVFKTGKRATQV